jgi:hypothetical protein
VGLRESHPTDTPDPDYREYMDKVKQRIYSKWGYRTRPESGVVGKLTIEFHIVKDATCSHPTAANVG